MAKEIKIFDFLFLEATADQVLYELTARSGLYKSALESVKPHIERGEKVVSGGRKGHERAHGNDKQKRQRWRDYQKALNAVAREYPGWKKMAIYKEAADRCGVDEKTIRRRAKLPG